MVTMATDLRPIECWRNQSKWCAVQLALSAIVFCTGPAAISQGEPASAERVDAEGRAAPALAFSESDVEDLVARIEEPRARGSLKYRYFGSRRHVDWPRAEGYAALRDSFGGARPGTARWFCLGSVAAFAESWLGESVGDDWSGVYTRLFDAAEKAPIGAARAALAESVLDITGFLASRVRSETGPTAPHPSARVPSLVIAALRVWLAQPASRSVALDPRWGKILQASGDEDDALRTCSNSS